MARASSYTLGTTAGTTLSREIPPRMTPRHATIIALGALVPVWLYALGVHGGLPVALASTICVLLIAGSLYLLFGPHDEASTEPTDPGGL